MGFESDRLHFIKYNLETVKTAASKSTNCDINTALTLEKLFSVFATANCIAKNAEVLTSITCLDLSNCNLTEIPEKCSIPNLKQLNLSHNKFNQIPQCLFNGLKGLEFLDLGYNEISNFDRQPDCITNLIIIRLNNNLFDNIPKWFLTFRASNLLEMDYSNNKAKHYVYLKNRVNSVVNKLLKLQLGNCQLIDSDYSFLRQFKYLRYLDIGNSTYKYSNNFEEIDELFINLKWKHLLVLKASYLRIVIFPKGILWLESLVELYINDNYISWIPEDIKYMINLEILEVSRNYLVSLPGNLIYLNELKIIKANENVLEDTPNFTLMKHLEVLDLYANKLVEISIGLTSLTFVDIEHNFFNTQELDIYLQYLEKKEAYRKTFLNSRTDGLNYVPSICDSDSYKGSSEDDILDESRKLFNSDEPVIVEDWEEYREPCQNYRCSFIDSDDDWNGEEVQIKSNNLEISEKIYVMDEDWMFDDADEDLVYN